jgi:hypothetical protein
MMYNTQNYWVSGLCQSSSILKTKKHTVSETGFVSVPSDGSGRGTHYVKSMGKIKKSSNSNITLLPHLFVVLM